MTEPIEEQSRPGFVDWDDIDDEEEKYGRFTVEDVRWR